VDDDYAWLIVVGGLALLALWQVIHFVGGHG